MVDVRLPAELLIHVFYSLTEDIDDSWALCHGAPVILSHVCRQWRDIAISTSPLWSCILCQSIAVDIEPITLFIQRSRNTPLELIFRSPDREEDDRVRSFLHALLPYIRRWHSAVFQCKGSAGMERVITFLNSSTRELSNLRSLDLSAVGTKHDVFPRYSQSSENGNTIHAPNPHSLTHLRLQQVSLIALSRQFLSNLHSLELLFPSSSEYILRMSTLFEILSHLHQLRDFVLGNSKPILFDISVHDDQSTVDASSDNDNLRKPIRPFELPLLTRIEWSYPDAAQVHRFLSFFTTPALERFELFLGKSHERRGNHGQHETNWPVTRVLRYDSLKELNVECVDATTFGAALVKFSFPQLVKCEISNVGMQAGGNSPKMHTLQRLESIFRDPRLPHLSHLTLSHFKLSQDHGKAMLGYMPALTSLVLDTCTDVNFVLDGLKDACACAIPGGPVGVRKKMVCPLLESLSLWGCGDVEFERLRGVVRIRNVSDSEDVAREGPKAPEANLCIMERKIRPLRRLRRPAGAPIADGLDSEYPSIWSVSSAMNTANDISRPSKIRSIETIDCSLIKEEDVLSLRDLGVEEVSWNG
jgi:hypothetical protein